MRPGWGVSNSRAELDTRTLAGSDETHLLTTTTLGHLRQWYILLQVILCILGIPGTITHLQPWGRLTRVPDPPTHLTYPSNQSWTDGKPPWADVATDVYMWCLAWDIALKGHIPFASCYFAEIVLLNWAFLPDLKDASKSTCSIMMHQRTAVHFSLTQRRNNTQSRGDLWVSSLMYSKVATKLKSREVANYVCIKRDYYEPVEEMLGFLPPKIFPHRPTSHMLPGPGLLAAKEGITETCSQAHFNEFPKQSAFPLAEFCRYISTSRAESALRSIYKV